MSHRLIRVMVFMAIVLGLAVGASAQSVPVTYSSDTPISGQVTTNTCTVGEPVVLSGNMHFQYSFTTDSTTGMTQFAITVSSNLAGVGQTSGANYLAADSNDYNPSSANPPLDMTVDFKSDLNSQGGTPSMTLIQSLEITVDTMGNISGQVLSNNTQCGS